MRATAYFTPDEVAEVLDVTRRWIYHLIETGRLDAHQKNGRHWRVECPLMPSAAMSACRASSVAGVQRTAEVAARAVALVIWWRKTVAQSVR